jgi:hypothetical protein
MISLQIKNAAAEIEATCCRDFRGVSQLTASPLLLFTY